MSISHVIDICMILLMCISCNSTTVTSRHNGAKNENLSDRMISYWDAYDVSSANKDSLEQKIVDYLFLIGHLNYDIREDAWSGFFRNIPEQPNRTVVEYLGEADSPLYSPELLEEYLKLLIKMNNDEAVEVRTSYLLENIQKNSVGDKISDLQLRLGNKNTSLHKILKETDGDCLIIFYDPECSSCDDLFKRLQNRNIKGITVIAVSISEITKADNTGWISLCISDKQEFEDKFYYTSLPSVYVTSSNGVIIGKGISL